MHLASGTMTGLAIQYAVNIAFSESEGARPLKQNVPRIIMIVTDGRPQDPVAEIAAKARNSGILIFAIGVGRVDMNTLKSIGSEPHEEHVFLVANFSQIETLTSVFQTKLCGKVFIFRFECIGESKTQKKIHIPITWCLFWGFLHGTLSVRIYTLKKGRLARECSE